MSAESPENQSTSVSPYVEETAAPVSTVAAGDATQTTTPADSSDAASAATGAKSSKLSTDAQPNGGSNRVYINNVSYSTTETDLYDFVKDFDVVSVLIPSHTVRGFKNLKQQSLGIAYVDFTSPEEAERATNALNGKELNKRVLRLKPFVPYIPNRVIVKANRKNKKTEASTSIAIGCTESTESSTEFESDAVHDSESGVVESAGVETPDVETSAKTKPDEQATAVSEPTVFSTDTVFIERLAPKTTDSDLRAFFANYGPTEVYIFKCRYLQAQKSKNFFHHRQYVSALITLGSEDGLSNALKDLKGTKLKGQRVVLKASYLSKIDEVKRAAQAQQIPVQKIENKHISGSAAPSAPSATSATSATSASSVEGCVSSKTPCPCSGGSEDDDCDVACHCGDLPPNVRSCGRSTGVDDEMIVTGAPVEPVN